MHATESNVRLRSFSCMASAGRRGLGRRKMQSFSGCRLCAGRARLARLWMRGRRSREMDFEALAADLEATIAERRLQRPVLVGHSLGGMIAQTMLRRRPDGYRRGGAVLHQPGFRQSRRRVPAQVRGRSAGAARQRQAHGRSRGRHHRRHRRARAGSGGTRACDRNAWRAVPADTYRAAVRCLVAFDERANLATIRVPVLCLSGEHDRNAPPQMMERMAGKSPAPAMFACRALDICRTWRRRRRSMRRFSISCAMLCHST